MDIFNSSHTPFDIVQDISKLAEDDDAFSQFGSFSSSIYDTAWLSMVRREGDGQEQLHWIFDGCFEFILEAQQDDGTWPSYASPVDGILNTLASLLALATRMKLSMSDKDTKMALQHRIDRAQNGLSSILQRWKVREAIHVGFEILIPSLLRQLEGFRVVFRFSGFQELMQLHDKKMKRFKSSMVYSAKQTTLLHSLEALVGLIEFERVSHHCNEKTGILGSPSSTAAYFINNPRDIRAEKYLRSVLVANKKSFAVPSAYPTCIFELSWALSTLVPNLPSPTHLETAGLGRISSALSTLFEKQNGLVGFAPGVLEDADDTARVILALRSLGLEVDPKPMIEMFESETYFKTYLLEQNASFSTNCNVLLALLSLPSPDTHLSQIEKALAFLLERWETRTITDKWNISSYYSLMLISEALVGVLKRRDDGHLQKLSAAFMEDRVPAAICQILSYILANQHEDCSWAHSQEITAYCVMALSHHASLPWSLELGRQVAARLEGGQRYIKEHQSESKSSDGNYLWIEKTTYASSLLHNVYCTTAIHVLVPQKTWKQQAQELFCPRTSDLAATQHLTSALPMFSEPPLLSLELALLEAKILATRLQRARHTIVTKEWMKMKEGKYLKYIPFIWVACNQRNGNNLSSNAVWDMVTLSLFIYQMDELMESIVGQFDSHSLQKLASKLAQECGFNFEEEVRDDALQVLHLHHEDVVNVNDKRRAAAASTTEEVQAEPATFEVVTKILSGFIQHVLQHPAVLQSPLRVQRELATEVYNFLIAHVNHSLDGKSLRKSSKKLKLGADSDWSAPSSPFALSQTSYFKWVHTTASDDTSCPFAFKFFLCLIGQSTESYLGAPQEKYYSQSLVRHLSTMCRQYNDYGSAKRDAEESNLNSLDFPDFQSGAGSAARQADGGCDSQSMKQELMAIAEFERSCMQLALQNLRQVASSAETVEALET
ncbi:MAG: hypothetical protein LQ340_004453, partial [Diploschistes diacapsis]